MVVAAVLGAKLSVFALLCVPFVREINWHPKVPRLLVFSISCQVRFWRRNWHPSTDFRFSSGQALVEFTLVFLLLLVIAWIPADFGLGFYTGQLAQNASREAARIAAADPNLADASCVMPCSSAAAGTALNAAAGRMSQGLLPGASISVTLEPAGGANCNRLVDVSISGNYNFFYYRLLQGLGVASVNGSANIQRSTKMRWEHQPGCQT